jgi:hypothetical protein
MRPIPNTRVGRQGRQVSRGAHPGTMRLTRSSRLKGCSPSWRTQSRGPYGGPLVRSRSPLAHGSATAEGLHEAEWCQRRDHSAGNHDLSGRPAAERRQQVTAAGLVETLCHGEEASPHCGQLGRVEPAGVGALPRSSGCSPTSAAARPSLTPKRGRPGPLGWRSCAWMTSAEPSGVAGPATKGGSECT